MVPLTVPTGFGVPWTIPGPVPGRVMPVPLIAELFIGAEWPDLLPAPGNPARALGVAGVTAGPGTGVVSPGGRGAG
jgi:hypothetical protein